MKEVRVTDLGTIEKSVIACKRCPELRSYCSDIALTKKPAYRDDEYWAKPVPAFGDPKARVMLVGLAPGAHGSNRTGRMFTGDASGDFLYPALFRAGFASQPNAVHARDGMQLTDCIITAAERCAPPKNKPTPRQLKNCFPYLVEEIEILRGARVVVGLGSIGFNAAANALKSLGFVFQDNVRPKFGHGAEYRAHNGRRVVALLGCYHPSRQNTNTGVLSASMLDSVLERAKYLASPRRRVSTP